MSAPTSDSRMTVRDAEQTDISALMAIKGDDSEALHRDRLRDALGPGFRYLVLTVGRDVVAFTCLVFRRPSSWSDADDTEHLPQVVDLQVKESLRGHGYGSTFLGTVERIVATAGYRCLYLRVDPVSNPRAYALYRRLGYQQLQAEPYHDVWEFENSTGQVHRGEGWVVDLMKPVGP